MASGLTVSAGDVITSDTRWSLRRRGGGGAETAGAEAAVERRARAAARARHRGEPSSDAAGGGGVCGVCVGLAAATPWWASMLCLHSLVSNSECEKKQRERAL